MKRSVELKWSGLKVKLFHKFKELPKTMFDLMLVSALTLSKLGIYLLLYKMLSGILQVPLQQHSLKTWYSQIVVEM